MAIVPFEESQDALMATRAQPLGQAASFTGRVTTGELGRVTMRTLFGGNRIVAMPVGEQLPRLC